MTNITCRLTAKNRDRLRNPTLGNRVWATFTFFCSSFGLLRHYVFDLSVHLCVHTLDSEWTLALSYDDWPSWCENYTFCTFTPLTGVGRDFSGEFCRLLTRCTASMCTCVCCHNFHIFRHLYLVCNVIINSVGGGGDSRIEWSVVVRSGLCLSWVTSVVGSKWNGATASGCSSGWTTPVFSTLSCIRLVDFHCNNAMNRLLDFGSSKGWIKQTYRKSCIHEITSLQMI